MYRCTITFSYIVSTKHKSRLRIPNDRLAGPLEELSAIYAEALDDEWRSKAHARVAAALRKLDFEVTDAAQLAAVPQLAKGGGSLREKVAIILGTGR